MIPFPYQAGQLGRRRAQQGVGAPTDPNFANVSLLLHFGGTDGSTTFTDNSPNAFTISAFGNAQIDTAQSKFGGASGLFDGAGDYISAPNDTDFDVGGGNWTIEYFVRPRVLGVFTHLAKRSSAATYGPYVTYMLGSGEVGLLCSNNNTSWTTNLVTTGFLSAGVWTHLAFVRNGNVFTIYVDGTSRASATVSGALITNTQPVVIGVGGSDANSPFDGHVDELRITKGVARYTANFTAPTAQFPDS